MSSGIYQLLNLVNNKRYVGSAVNLKRRNKQHFSDLRKGKHHCIHLQNAFEKYGEENFIFEVLEIVEDKNNLLQWEQWFLDYYDFESLYNTCPTAGNSLGVVRSEETKEKLRKANLGKRHSEETKEKCRIASLGKISKRHSEETKIRLSKANKGKIFSEETKEKLRIAKLGKRRSEETKKKIGLTKQKPVIRIDPNTGERTRFSSIKETGAIGKNVSSVIKGKRKTAGGFYWEYAETNGG